MSQHTVTAHNIQSAATHIPKGQRKSLRPVCNAQEIYILAISQTYGVKYNDTRVRT